MLFSEMMRLFLNSRRRGTDGARKQARPRTLEGYDEMLRPFWRFMEERSLTSYEQIKRVDILEYIEWVSKKEADKQWSKATRLKSFRSLRTLFLWVERDEDCKAEELNNWARLLPVIEKTPRRAYIPSTGDLRRFLAAFDTSTRAGYRDYTAMMCLLGSGARIGELCHLKLDQLKLDDKLLVIPEEGKTGTRIVPITQDLVRLFRGWLRFRSKFAKCGYVFVNEFGDQCNPNTFGQSFRKLRKRHNLPPITPHTNRHAFCTYYLRDGGSMAKLRNITGHQSYRMLLDYEHLAEVGSQAAREELEKVSLLRTIVTTRTD
jgi:integrase/recombinase XerD